MSNFVEKSFKRLLNIVSLSVAVKRKNAYIRTASSKTKGEVKGGGKKPWRQKGTGRARAGSIRSPLWRGGGVVFGPKPGATCVKINKKIKKLSLKSLLLLKKNNISFLIPNLKNKFFLRYRESYCTKLLNIKYTLCTKDSKLFSTLLKQHYTVLDFLQYANITYENE